MKVGVSGHQEREGADWEWTDKELRSVLSKVPGPIEGWSSLAVGADQLFASAVLDMGGSTVTVVPGAWYEDCYDRGAPLLRYRELLARSAVVALEGLEGEEAFLQAGRRIVEECELLIAIWDGRPARGKGGTGDVVAYARELGRRVCRIDPVTRESMTITDPPGRA